MTDNYIHTKKYDKENTTKVTLKLNLKTDSDILEFLANCGNKQGTIKQLIRNEIESEKLQEEVKRSLGI